MNLPFSESVLDSASVCDRGFVRAENQDSFFSDGKTGLFVVADGMGGGQGGAQASALVAEAFGKSERTGAFAQRLESVRASIAAANAEIVGYARRAGYHQTGSTVAALLFGDGIPGEAAAVWVGDSRIYRVRDGAAEALTSDHTVANELFGRGGLGSSGYSRKLPYAHVLTRALGVDREVHPDVRRFKARPGDRYLVCSDGIHDMLADAKIAALVAAAASAASAVGALADAVRAAGAVDNFTATAVFLGGSAR